MAGPKDGWTRLAKNLKAEIDEELIETHRRKVSLLFEAGDNKRIEVKISGLTESIAVITIDRHSNESKLVILC